MIKVPITYLTQTGNEVTKDFWFNLNKADLVKINMSIPGGLEAFMNRTADELTWDDIDNVYEQLILTAYGTRTKDGKFIKSKVLTQEFAASDAYSEVYLKFLQNEDDFATKFLEGAVNMPKEEVAKAIADASETATGISETKVITEL